jgi:uncharacterized repeat protein (TIGR01451 family)
MRWPTGYRGGRLLVPATTMIVALALASSTSAAIITSSGPLTGIGVSEDLNCSVNYAGDEAGEFYGETACGTFVTVDGEHYGPAEVPAGNPGNPAYTPVSQSEVTGSGTTADPYTIVTVVDLGTSDLQLTETDSYIVGQESYRTEVEIHNSSGASVEAIVYRAGDCYLQDSDTGFGSVDPDTGAVACVDAVLDGEGEDVPGTRIEQWLPLSPGSAYYEAEYYSVWGATVSDAPFPNTCACDENIDNGAGLSWSVTIPAGGSVTRSSLITFSPLGHSPLLTTVAADSATATVGGTDGYTITISNPNSSPVGLASITDTLPTGFSYLAGSSSGATSSDPAIGGQMLTWAGPIDVTAASEGADGTVTLHFDVTVSNSTGTYFNYAGGESSEFTVVPTEDSAVVTVSGGGSTSTSTSDTNTSSTIASTATSSSGGSTSGTTAVPPPKLAVSGDVAPVSGSVKIKLPGSSTFVALASLQQIPFGTVVDATHGSVSVTTAGPHGGTQTVTLSGGEFVLTQGRNGAVMATLTGGDFSVCSTARERAHTARAASAHATGKHVVRKLWAEGHGNFATSGDYASASVRGTKWLTEDLCEGTLIHVATDRVAVTNLVNGRHVVVKAGHSYLAKAP